MIPDRTRVRQWTAIGLLSVLLLTLALPLTAAEATQLLALPMPPPTEVLLDVAAHNPALIASIRGDTQSRAKSFNDLAKLNVPLGVRAKMTLAVIQGSWIITTTTPVTSHGWTGTPWVAIHGPMQGFYNNAVPYTGWSSGDSTGVQTNGEDSTPGLEFAKDITAFGKALAQLGLALTAAGKGLPGPAGKAAMALGLAITALGLAVTAVGLEQEAAILGASPKNGHADDEDSPPNGGGPAGSAPNGPGAEGSPTGNPPGSNPGLGQSIGVTGPDGTSAGGGGGGTPGTPGDSGATGPGGGDL